DPVNEPGALGSPGLPNQPCESNLPPTSCREGDSVRDVVAPQPGDLVITEVMPNPSAADDATGEWFEVLVNRDVDLNGLKMGKSAASLDEQLVSLTCLRVTAGTYLIFARTEDGTANGGLPWVDFTFDFGLTNSGGGLALGYGEVLLDEVSWSSSHAGKSLALEPSLTDPQQNDNQAYWCEGQQPYGAGDLGSPGQQNPDCGITPEGKCREGGSLRDQRIPGPGDLVITEIMADPSAASDASGEWFEVYAVRDLDLNHLQIGKTFPTVDLELPGGDCLPAAAGSYVVLARNSDPASNGGLPSVLATFDFGLTNSGGSLFIAFGDQLLDAVTYGAATAGASSQLDAARIDPASNDDPAAWCTTPAGNTYGAGDRGTPAAANPSCQ
ncbi:MAG: lamin tail domain-containing protein, partial [Deltaproteobacteria bacterium]